MALCVVCLGAMLALSLIGGVILYVVWGSVILQDNEVAKGGGLCDDEHVWMYVFVCVLLVACGFCCGIGLCNTTVCARDEYGDYQPGMFPIITATIGIGVFGWGILQYSLLSQDCKEKFRETYPRLWLFFYASFIIQVVGGFVQVAFFLSLCCSGGLLCCRANDDDDGADAQRQRALRRLRLTPGYGSAASDNGKRHSLSHEGSVAVVPAAPSVGQLVAPPAVDPLMSRSSVRAADALLLDQPQGNGANGSNDDDDDSLASNDDESTPLLLSV
jgi:hypothetical protein